VALQVMEETAKELDLVANELIDPLGAKELVSFRPAQWPRLVEFAVRLQQPLHTIASYLDTKRTQLRESSADVPRAVAAQLVSHIGAQYQQAVEWAAWSRHVSSAATRAEDAAPIATWAQRGTDGGVSLHAAPTDVAGHLRSWLIDRAHGLVFTSATLRTLGTFDYFASRTGLTGKAATYIALPSPFALDKQAQLIVPAVACDPREENRHNQMVAEYVSQVYARAAGTLVIFTSRRQMTAVRDLLDKQIGKRVLVSGSKPIERLLKTHRARIRKGEASILFGMDSFAEGLDLPGRECEVLVIARLPFLPPDGPVAKTRSEWLSARGRSFFAEEAVPQAYHRLVQRLGRLIRSERDTGTIHILDRRITSTQYGRRMWEALPPYTKVVETNVTGGERRSVG
jgi:ATP-dependent DNA helicase DinG